MVLPNATTQEPWYESNLLWGSIGGFMAIVLTVIAAMLKDLRWLLLLAWPFGGLFMWACARKIQIAGLRWLATMVGMIAIGAGLMFLYGRLLPPKEPQNPPATPTAVVPSTDNVAPTKQPPTVRLPLHTRGFLQIEKPEILRQYSFIAPGKQWGGNIHSTNPGPEKLFDVFGFSKAYLERTDEHTDARVLASFWSELRTIRKDYMSGKIKGTEQGVGPGPWGTVLTDPLTEEQCGGIVDGSMKIYIVSWCIWKDSQNRMDTAFYCRWLQQLPPGKYSKRDLVWHSCQEQ